MMLFFLNPVLGWFKTFYKASANFLLFYMRKTKNTFINEMDFV